MSFVSRRGATIARIGVYVEVNENRSKRRNEVLWQKSYVGQLFNAE